MAAECDMQLETEVPSMIHPPTPAHVVHPAAAAAWGTTSQSGLVSNRCSATPDMSSTIPAGPFTVQESCIVFDWDDTLFPSSFVDRRKLIHARHVEDLPEELQQGFRDLEKLIARLISTASKYATVLIITNAQTGWVELCASKFMPSLLDLLAGSVRVVSARTSFEKFFPGDPLCWKAATFAHELHQLQKTKDTVLRNVISFGDSIEERTSVKIAASQLRARSKSIKFLDAPTFQQLHQELEVVTNCLEWIWKHSGDLDVVLTLEGNSNSGETSPRSN